AFGMLVSVSILWWFRGLIEPRPAVAAAPAAAKPADVTAVTAAPPPAPGGGGQGPPRPVPPLRPVPDWPRLRAPGGGVLVVIIFWTAFYQGGSTITYWGDKNTDWNVSGIISNAINPAWVIALTFPLIWFWRWLAEKGLEPSTPGKMVIGMFLAALAFLV